MTRFEMGFPVDISSLVPPLLYGLNRAACYTMQSSNGITTLTFICSTVQTSRSTDLTLLICVPMERWMPEHRMHKNTPLLEVREVQRDGRYAYRFHDAHRGSGCVVSSGWHSKACILTVPLAVCAHFVFGTLQKLAQHLVE